MTENCRERGEGRGRGRERERERERYLRWSHGGQFMTFEVTSVQHYIVPIIIIIIKFVYM
jgi:hypothetical protein